VAYDERLAERIRAVFEKQSGVHDVKMMGGLVFMVNGHMCCGATGSDLMVRVGPDAYEKALTRTNVKPLDIGGGRTPRAFICVSAEGIKTKAALRSWVQKGVEFVETLPAKKTRQK